MSKYVKFTSERVNGELTPFDGFAELNAYRRKLRELRLIGVDSVGIGFGNLSMRDGATKNFYITGSATAGIAELKPADCAKVVAYDFERNWIGYEGSTVPSSESLTHAAIYESDATVAAVIHCHDSGLWSVILNQALMRLFSVTDVRSKKTLAMAGHEGGVVTFGKDLEEAFTVLMDARKESAPCVNDTFRKRNPA